MINPYSNRKYIIGGIFIAFALIFIIRLFYLQIIDTSYKFSADNNSQRRITKYPARGVIYDRNGKILVFNEAAFDLMVIPQQTKQFDTIDLCSILEIEKDEFTKKFKDAKLYSTYRPSVIISQISSKTYAILQEKLFKFPGFFVQGRTLRKYPQPIASHILGYVGEVDPKKIKENAYYKQGDYIGISGIERTYENFLRGQKGVSIFMVDVHNKIMGSFAEGKFDTAAVIGTDIKTTIDADLQLYGEKLMSHKKGSIVAIDPSTGEILMVVSSPSYDPGLLVGRIRSKNYVNLLKDTLKPLFNRAIMASYPPGSTFKLVMALIGQQEGVLNANTRYPCSKGYAPLGGHPKCHPHGSPLDLSNAIGHSCNSYFSYVFKSVIENKKYHNTNKAFEAWRNIALSFCIGKKTGSDFSYELRGNIPSIKYYDKIFGKGKWKASTVISLGIGQAEMGITPLQSANVVAIIANRGWYYIPHIVKSIGNNTNDTTLARFKIKNYTMITDTNIFLNVIQGMSDAVESGTAASLKIEGINFCAKTGTAENPHGKDHSVFVAFAPTNNPRIAISVLVENAGFGAAWAGPIASLIMEKHLTGKIKRPDLEKHIMETNLIGD
jgi:penicillin-binding protein 2